MTRPKRPLPVGTKSGAPSEPVVIESVTITEAD